MKLFTLIIIMNEVIQIYYYKDIININIKLREHKSGLNEVPFIDGFTFLMTSLSSLYMIYLLICIIIGAYTINLKILLPSISICMMQFIRKNFFKSTTIDIQVFLGRIDSIISIGFLTYLFNILE